MNEVISAEHEPPERPSVVKGYWPIAQDRRIPAIKRRALLAKFFLIVIPLLTIGAFFVEWPEWLYQVEKLSPIGTDWIQLALLLAAFGLTALCFNYTFGGWQSEHKRVWWEVQDGNIALVAQSICSALAPSASWQWIRPANWGDCYLVVVGGHTLAIVNLATDWIGYAKPGSVTEIQYNCRQTGSVTKSKTHAQTYGGGRYAYVAQTNAQTSGETICFYEHIVDLYSNMPGNEHICANFGGNEALAKEAYAMLLPLTRSGS